LQIGTVSLLEDTSDFLESISNGVSSTPDVVSSSVKVIKDNVSSIDIVGTLGSTVGVPINLLHDSMVDLHYNITFIILILNSTNRDIGTIKSIVNAIPARIQTIKSQVSSMTSISINGTRYLIPGIPDLSTFQVSGIPDTSKIPDLSGYINSFNDIPNLKNVADNFLETYSNITKQIPTLLNDTLNTKIPDVKNLTNNFLSSSLNETITGITSTLSHYKNLENSLFDQLFPFDTIRDTLTAIEVTIIMAAAGLSVVGMFTKKHIVIMPYIFILMIDFLCLL
jgi:hypothetical protein